MSTSSGISSVKELSNISMRLNNHLQLTLQFFLQVLELLKERVQPKM